VGVQRSSYCGSANVFFLLNAGYQTDRESEILAVSAGVAGSKKNNLYVIESAVEICTGTPPFLSVVYRRIALCLFATSITKR